MMGEPCTLISFLGTGKYQETEYYWRDRIATRTRFVALALAEITNATDVIITATTKAEETHGQVLRQTFIDAGLVEPAFERLADGKTENELWANFATIKALLARQEAGKVVLDITHGFRSQPFFTAAVVMFVRALKDPLGTIQVVYGAFDAKTPDNRSPIWDLTAFIDLVDWTHGLRNFLRTGDAREIAKRTEDIGRSLSKAWARSGKKGESPHVTGFAKTLKDFSDALLTVRVGEMLLDRTKGEKPSKGDALVRSLGRRLDDARSDLEKYAPPLAEVFDRIAAMIDPLRIDANTLTGVDGHRAMAALARLYWDLGRYAEAASVMREGWVNRHASSQAARPGSEGCNKETRRVAEDNWGRFNRDLQREIANVRNDIEHAGFRTDPLPAGTIQEQVDKLIRQLSEASVVEGAEVARSPVASSTYFVTRHLGARDWADQEGIAVDEIIDHLEVESVQPGDVVIGSLPVNLAAEVCARGGRYLHLILDMNRELRGRELTVEEMRACGARVEEYRLDSA